jgi:hypothetical protein
MNQAVSNPVGRPSKYDAKIFPRTCAFLAARGATIAEMADACAVDTRTFYNWMNEYPELNEAVAALPAKSFLIDGEAIVTNAEGLAVFDLIHHVQTSIDDSGS